MANYTPPRVSKCPYQRPHALSPNAELPNHVFSCSPGKRSLARAHMRAPKSNKRTTPPSPANATSWCAAPQYRPTTNFFTHSGSGVSERGPGLQTSKRPRKAAKRAHVAPWLGLLLAGATGCGLKPESRAQNGEMPSSPPPLLRACRRRPGTQGSETCGIKGFKVD